MAGEILTREQLNEIANNYRLSKHAQERLAERGKGVNVKKVLLNPLLAYFNTDGSINIAKDKFNYFVIVKKSERKYLVVTYKEKSKNNITIFDKWNLAKKGIDRN